MGLVADRGETEENTGGKTSVPPVGSRSTRPWRMLLLVTIAEVLRRSGYATYMCGKWHVTNRERAGDNPYNWPLQRGYEKFYGTIIGAGSFYDPVSLTEGNAPIEPEGEDYYYTDAIADNVVCAALGL